MTRRLHYENIFWIGLIHILAVVALFFFTWPAFILCICLLIGVSTLGINLTYHRLLTHRGFKVPMFVEYILATIGALSGQGPMMIWVAEHRLHHRYSDTPKDPHSPHSPTESFFHGHMGHLFYHKEFEDDKNQWFKYVPDLAGHKYYVWLNRFFVIPLAISAGLLYWWGGMPFLMWGMFVRITLMWHMTWSVNSAAHTWGYRNYETSDQSTNCWWVGVLASGEGWHNNHHAQPSCARHGHKWWELDLTFAILRVLELFGIATDVKRPKRLHISSPAIPDYAPVGVEAEPVA